MSDLQTIKKRILREDKVEAILEAIECEYIHFSGNRIEAQLPHRYNSTNKRAVQVKLTPSLNCAIRNKSDFNGDIFSLVSYVHRDMRGEDVDKDLPRAKVFICELFGWNEYLNGKYKAKKDYVAPLKALNRRKRVKDIIPNPVISETVLDEYYLNPNEPLPYAGWIDEGIPYETQVMYGIGFDLDSKRITIPLRNRFGQLVGVKGRILIDSDSDKKYMYLHRCNNRYEWFNFHYCHPYVLAENRIYIFEAEKSCMKAFAYGIYNTVAIGASEISDEQIQIIKKIGLDTEIVLCYDKGIDRDEIEDTAKRFGNRKVYIMFDDKDVLEGEKSAPIDEGLDKWNFLVENCIKESKNV